ncbi:MAG TPA: NAD(P)H-binding protein [Gaiellaceae bacterium]|nr:NAD(P)H-binding protein [Gaiellaceae bacterium]
MRVAVLGASGRTGRELAAQALARGHEVVAFVRSRERLGPLAERVAVVEGDATSRADVERALEGVEAVLSALGPVKGGPPDAMRRAAENVVQAMEARGLRRLVWLTGAGVAAPGDPPSRIRSAVRALLRLVAPRTLEDSDAAFAAIAGSHLEWTVVRAPRLRDGPGRGRLAALAEPPRPVAVARADVAAFMLDQLEDDRHVRRAPFVAYR